MIDSGTRRGVIGAGASAGAALATTGSAWGMAQDAAQGGEHRLWFDRPGRGPLEALLLGNGRLGALILGQAGHETIPLNEDTLWAGQPKQGDNPAAKAVLPQVREAVFAGDYQRADALCKQMQGPWTESYAPMADLHLLFDHGDVVEDYGRALDLDAAIATVRYARGATQYQREMFVSHPDQVIVVRLSTQGPDRLNLRVGLDSKLRHATLAEGHRLVLQGKAPTHCEPNYRDVPDPVVYADALGQGMHFATVAELVPRGGRVVVEDQALRIEGAREVLIILSAATGFVAFDQAPNRTPEAVLANALRALEQARAKGLKRLRQDHLADHRRLYRRMSLTLGDSAPSPRPTDQRLAANAKAPEPALAALYFHFSRYLLIAASRPGTQAANLQGIWNWELRPPWSSNYTTNINIQENYWGAESGNLAELHEPLFDMVEGLAQNGARTAQTNYGLDGWCVHHNTDLWRATSPVGVGQGDPTWANWPMAAPWFVRHLWEHYQYGLDRDFLAKRAYPLMKGAAQFCAGWLVPDPRNPGVLTTAPSFSTENDFLGPAGRAETSAGCTMDIALIREVFANTAEAAQSLGIDAPFADHLTALARKLPPYQIGRHGQLQEWEFDFDEPQPEQRHISHLYPVYPGREITPRTAPALARAASTSLQRRLEAGGASTGWSRAWAVNVFARLGDSGRAIESFNWLIDHGTSAALLDECPSAGGPLFQIDGNFAGGAAITEMLVQSHEGVLALLPALPQAWTTGSIKGVRARGGLTLEMNWSQGRLRTCVIDASTARPLKVRLPDGQRLSSLRKGRALTPFTVAAGLYDLELSPGRYVLDVV